MGNPRLTTEQLTQAYEVLGVTRRELEQASGGDPTLLFALRRKVQKELMHDERGTPAHRNKIKKLKRIEQANRCPMCGKVLPEKNAVLDRVEAVHGYTVENTRLVHQDCDIRAQAAKGFT
jgi:hypothetical protein